ncbi:MAG: M23 family metallopeptidase [Treponema sp.]|uniref:M23 family metallopeptidase n=1 Tax=Treponema sp. TaxID=166 RepID=UPI001B3CA8A4|nr:M23 family metallopeptidase [Treponema sp.]MBP5402454.1 M23 family metallopeptidase [Treponema sp.]MBR5933279.1 M23 family metallopeptidase [Treponema sp.]
MKIKILIISLFLSIVQLGLVFSDEFSYKGNYCDITAIYNPTSYPGEAYWIRLLIESHKKNKIYTISAKASLVGEKTISESNFFSLNPKKKMKNVSEMLSGIPTWSTVKPQEDTKIVITFSYNEEETETFEFPVIFAPKDYLEETLHLNESLTDLVSKPSPEKKEQSRVLNETLQTIDSESVYDLTPFIKPTAGKRITSEFGQTRKLIYKNGKTAPSYHAGIDYGIPEGSEIISCAAGRVVMARWRIVTGYSVIVEHLPGLYSIYYHLSELKCKEGDIVKKGQLIALSGKTGFATGPHLHWEVRLNGICLDPDSFIKNYTYQMTSEKQ